MERESSRTHDKRNGQELLSPRRASSDSCANRALWPLTYFSSIEEATRFLLSRYYFTILRRSLYLQLTDTNRSFSSNWTIEWSSEGPFKTDIVLKISLFCLFNRFNSGRNLGLYEGLRNPHGTTLQTESYQVLAISRATMFNVTSHFVCNRYGRDDA